jgi:hypothetical protein
MDWRLRFRAAERFGVVWEVDGVFLEAIGDNFF